LTLSCKFIIILICLRVAFELSHFRHPWVESGAIRRHVFIAFENLLNSA